MLFIWSRMNVSDGGSHSSRQIATTGRSNCHAFCLRCRAAQAALMSRRENERRGRDLQDPPRKDQVEPGGDEISDESCNRCADRAKGRSEGEDADDIHQASDDMRRYSGARGDRVRQCDTSERSGVPSATAAKRTIQGTTAGSNS